MKRLREISIPTPNKVIYESVKRDHKSGSVTFQVIPRISIELHEIEPELMVCFYIDQGLLAVHLAYENKYTSEVDLVKPVVNLDDLPIIAIDEQKKIFKHWLKILANSFNIKNVTTDAKTMRIQIEIKDSIIKPSEILKFKEQTRENLSIYVANKKLYARLDIVTKNV
jgi:hypothetical protein